MTPKAVVFDLGKVLLNFDYGIAIRKLQARCRISLEELNGLIDQSPLLYQYETALLTTEQFFAEIRSKSGYGGDFADFADVFGDIFIPIEPMVQLHAALRSQALPTYIFSNTNFLAVEHIRRRYSFFQDFDGHILSCEHGAMKPDEKLYQIVERYSGKQGSDLLYIDDRPENIATGSRLGWQTILHQSPEQTIAEVRKAGLL
jgi:epoxide hydrolase-like predicted phosphatase